MTDPLVRAHRTAVRVPGFAAPYDTVHLTVRYPALPAADDLERMSGVLRADPTTAPFPVVVLVPGVNVHSESYRWLALRLAARGYAAVSFDWVTEIFPGQPGLSPGVDLAAVTPDGYGTAPTTPALRPVLDALAELTGPLSGLLDLDHVGLFGHSAGGTVALQSARAAWFPEVRAVLTYGAHTMASQQLGWPAGTLLEAPVSAPVMLVGGDADGVVRASAIRYGDSPDSPDHDPLRRTFDEALPPTIEAWLVTLAGATHLLPVHPEDPSSARGFLEQPTGAEDALRLVLGDLVGHFLDAHLRDSTEAKAALDALSDRHADRPDPAIAALLRR